MIVGQPDTSVDLGDACRLRTRQLVLEQQIHFFHRLARRLRNHKLGPTEAPYAARGKHDKRAELDLTQHGWCRKRHGEIAQPIDAEDHAHGLRAVLAGEHLGGDDIAVDRRDTVADHVDVDKGSAGVACRWIQVEGIAVLADYGGDNNVPGGHDHGAQHHHVAAAELVKVDSGDLFRVSLRQKGKIRTQRYLPLWRAKT